MGKVETKTAGKIGLFSAVMIVFGSVVGIGIFFKNGSVFKSNNYITAGVIGSWLIAILIALCSALSFSHLASCKIRKNEGLGGWARVICGDRFGRFTKISHSLVYYVVQTFSCLFFGGEAIINLFAQKSGEINFGPLTTLYAYLAALALIIFFVAINVFASKFALKFGGCLSLIKFIPIISVILLGIIFGSINGAGLWNGKQWDGNSTYVPVQGSFSLIGMISCIPAILFAYEGYLVIGNVANEVENPDKNVPLAVVLGMVVVTFVNLGITIGCITAGTGNVYQLMHIIFAGKETLIKVFSTIFSIFIVICIFGVCNGMICAGVKSCEAAAFSGVLFKSKSLLAISKNNPLLAGGIYYIAITLIMFVATMVPSVILNTDQLVDHVSNALVAYFYLIYGATIFGGLINSFTKKVEVKSLKGFRIFASISIIGAIFVFSFIGFYQNLIGAFMNPNNDDFVKNLGLFFALDDGNTFTKFVNWQGAVVFWSFIIFFVALPFINDLLIKLFDKNNSEPLLWQKQNKVGNNSSVQKETIEQVANQ